MSERSTEKQRGQAQQGRAGDPLLALLAETSLDCIHCGLCLNTCPTYRLTGVESSSPRGRIALMRAAGEGRLEPGEGYREELDFCLLCRHCESACPAGVPYARMMELARDQARRSGWRKTGV
jgi:glycolate oxidase iron-sulfur subunit